MAHNCAKFRRLPETRVARWFSRRRFTVDVAFNVLAKQYLRDRTLTRKKEANKQLHKRLGYSRANALDRARRQCLATSIKTRINGVHLFANASLFCVSQEMRRGRKEEAAGTDDEDDDREIEQRPQQSAERVFNVKRTSERLLPHVH